jgi:hypothetical protein
MGLKIKRGKLRAQVEEAKEFVARLPKKKTSPMEKLWDFTILLFGLKKIGKTSMLSELGEGFFFPFESGTKALSVYQPLDEDGNRITFTADADGWALFKKYSNLVRKSKKRFPFAVIDPVDKAHKACNAWVCKKNGWEHPSDGAYGKGWSAVADEFAVEMDKLTSCGIGVVFISHATEKTIKTRTGDEYDLITSTMSNQAREAIEGVVDIWGYYHYQDEKRYLTILGDDHIGAGHRIKGHFRYTDGKRIRRIFMGNSEKEAAENLIAAFNNKLENPKGGSKKGEVKIGKK